MNWIDRALTHFGEARLRAERRKSPLNVALTVFGFAMWLALWYGLFRLVWLVHTGIYPKHQLRQFWREGISLRGFILSFVMTFSILPSAIALGLIISNYVFWLIKPFRRVLESEAGDVPGLGFRDSTRRLSKFCAWALPLGLVASLTAACLLKSLK